MFGSNEEGG